jgi:hypothetical protein
MNLFLAIVWLVLAVVLSTYEAINGPSSLRIRWGGVDLSLAWVMLLLALYNIARWYSLRMVRNEQRALYEALRQRLLQQRHASGEPGREPDPNFRFTDEPPPPVPPNLRDQPPSAN